MNRVRKLFSINPIIVKEIRSRMRGGRAFLTLTIMLLLMGGVLYATLQIILASSRYTNMLSPQVGQTMFATLAFLVLFMICAVTPAVTAGAISSEKEKLTYEMLMATPLSPTRILWGKLVSALSYVLLLVFAGIPLASLVFIFGGVAPREMVKALLVVLVVAVSFGVLGMFMSALFGRTGRATVAAFITVVILMLGPLFAATLVGVLRGGEPPRWILAPSPISALSAALAPIMSNYPGSEFFWVLGGIFNMGVSPVSMNGIPRPLYHYSLPFYATLSLVLYMLTTRLVQPTRRWQIRRRELLAGAGALVLLIALTAGLFLLTMNRYENASGNSGVTGVQVMSEPAFPMAAPPAVVQAEVPVDIATPTPADPALAVPAPTYTPIPLPADMIVAPLDESVQAEIYSQIIRRIYTVDHTFGDTPPNWPGLYVIWNTDDGVGDPNMTKSSSQVISEGTREYINKLVADLPTTVMWIDSVDSAAKDPKTGVIDGGGGAVITLGSIYMLEDNSLRVSASVYFGPLGAAGKTYILVNEGSGWKIIGTTGMEWMS